MSIYYHKSCDVSTNSQQQIVDDVLLDPVIQLLKNLTIFSLGEQGFLGMNILMNILQLGRFDLV